MKFLTLGVLSSLLLILVVTIIVTLLPFSDWIGITYRLPPMLVAALLGFIAMFILIVTLAIDDSIQSKKEKLQ
jgi:pilus assembly protein TadC